MKTYSWSSVLWSALCCLILFSLEQPGHAQAITHQITLPSGATWCEDSLINDLFAQINLFRSQNGAPALVMDRLGMKDAEIRATQFAQYMVTNRPGSPGFNPHQDFDTLAASLGYNIVLE